MAHLTLLHTGLAEPPSPWLETHAGYIRAQGSVLDVAAGRGRNARWLAQQGFQVEAVDRDEEALRSMCGIDGISLTVADLEQGGWPYEGRRFDAIVVCRYLHRPLFPRLIASLADGGVLIYETFMQGQEAYGGPSNPEFLLKPDELLQVFCADLEILAFEQGLQTSPAPCMLQRIVCRRNADGNQIGI